MIDKGAKFVPNHFNYHFTYVNHNETKQMNKNAKNIHHKQNSQKKFIVLIEETKSLPVSSNYKIVSKIFNNTYVISTSNDMEERKMIEELTSLNYVSFISEHFDPKLKNIFSSGFTQKNTKTPKTIIDEQGNPKQEYFERYINDKGIKGENEIVTLIDSLLDYYHDMFYDPDHQIEFKKSMADHRKIVFYDLESENEFLEIKANEHGIHVAGTIAGKSICNNSYVQHHDGIAPEAK